MARTVAREREWEPAWEPEREPAWQPEPAAVRQALTFWKLWGFECAGRLSPKFE